MAIITSKPFETLPDGRETTLYTLKNASGAYVNILDFGGIVQSICVPDQNGKLCDVALGFDCLAPYLETSKSGYMGALIGRSAGRFAGGCFTLNGKTYHLAKNDGQNHLHGGLHGFHNKVWRARVEDGTLILNTVSCHLEENYPGNLEIQVTYSFHDDNALSISYTATCDEDTVFNPTNHAYFNLEGQGNGTIHQNQLKLAATRFTPGNAECLTDGTYREVKGTVFDFLDVHPIGERIDLDDEQLNGAGGYDHCYVLSDGLSAPFQKVAWAYGPATGITMTVSTDRPAVVFYASNSLADGLKGKDGKTYGRRSGFCLECQYIPNAMIHENYASPILKAGEIYTAKTVYAFGTADSVEAFKSSCR